MRKEFEKVKSLKITVLMRVSAHGNGLYLYLPKDIVEAYGIIAGNKLGVQILDHYQPKTAKGVKAGGE